MPKIKFTPLITGIRGKLGRLVFRQSPSGETILSKAPDMSNVKWSPAQKEQRKRFKAANDYAQAAMADPQVRAVYEKQAAEQNRQPFRVAVSDYLKGNDLLAGKSIRNQQA
jgi:hypothetical protein